MTEDLSQERLQSDMSRLENELEHMLHGWGLAAESQVRTLTEIERLKAPCRLLMKQQPPAGLVKPTKEDLDALVLDWLWNEHEALMVKALEAEAACLAYETKYKVATKALSSKQTRLNADIKAALGPRA